MSSKGLLDQNNFRFARHVENCLRRSSNAGLSRQYEAQQFAESGCGVRDAGHFRHFHPGAALLASTAPEHTRGGS